MKQADIWIMLALVIALSWMVGTSYHYIINGAAEVTEHFPAIAAAIDEEDWQTARSLFAESKQTWQRVGSTWPMMINHEDMRDIEISFVDMDVLLEQENKERAARELANLQFFVEHVPENERLSLQNIL